MARYGDEFYGLAVYGADTLVDFDVSPFIVNSVDYGKIFVQWNTPTGDWDLIRLVRNGFGFPMTPDDGDVLLELDNADDTRTYIDVGQIPNNSGLIEGRTYYYTIFVRQSLNKSWVTAGNNLGVSVKNYGTADLMYDYLPTIYKVVNTFSATDNDADLNDQLYRFLQIFAFEHDLFKTTTENIKNRYDPLTIDGRLIPTLLNQFGFAFEREIGIQQARSLLKNAVKIYAERGSLSGIKTFATAFTGYNADILPIKNLMLDYNNASFSEAIGFWQADSNGVIARGAETTETPAISPYVELDSPANFPNIQSGFLKVTASASDDVTISCGTSAPLTRGIPVKAGSAYSLSLYSRAKTTSRSVVLNINWYDRFGDLISSAGEASADNSTSEWVRITGSSGTAPENCYYAIPQVRFEGCASGEVHYVDAVQFENASEPTTFADARRIDVVLRANRINQVLNPSFEESLDNWSVSNVTSFEQIEEGALEGSDYSLKVTLGDSIATVLSTDIIPIISGDQHAYSAYVKGTENASALLLIRWYDQSMQLINQYTSPSKVFTSSQEWSRITTERLAPGNAVYAQVGVLCAPATTGDEVYVDAILFEKAAFVADYFDGGAGYANLGDTIWELGDASSGRSHYYKNRDTIVKRLFTVLGDYVPSGSPWAVFVAQPD